MRKRDRSVFEKKERQIGRDRHANEEKEEEGHWGKRNRP
jgi:hypothetical protein